MNSPHRWMGASRGVEVSPPGAIPGGFMRGRRLLIIILTIIASSCPHSFTSGGLEEGRLAVFASPPSLLADGGEYGCIFIQVQSVEGDPMPAPRDIWVSLSSSNLEVGSVESPIVIPEGEYLKVAIFKATRRPGEAVITASASGYISGSASLMTFNPYSSSSPPYALRLYASPNPLPSEYGVNGTITVQLVGSEGTPITAISEVEVTVTSSNMSILRHPTSLTINRGESYGRVPFSSMGGAGSATITAQSEGFTPDSVKVSATVAGKNPARLSLSLSPSILLPGGSTHDSITIQLLDAGGSPTRALESIYVYLSSSNLDVGRVEKHMVSIEAGRYYTTARFVTGFKPGRTIIAAAAQGLEPSLATLEVRGPTPSRLSIYSAPPVILADGGQRDILALQVQGGDGVPMAMERDIEVYLASSSSLVGLVPPTAIIHGGESYVRVSFNSTLLPGDVEIVAHAHGLEASRVKVSTVSLPMNLSVEAPSSPLINETITVKVIASSRGHPVKNASVAWVIEGGEAIALEEATDSYGHARGVIRQTRERMRLVIEASRPGYQASKVERSIIAAALPKPPPEPTINILGLEVKTSILAIIIAIVIGIMTILYLYMRRKK